MAAMLAKTRVFFHRDVNTSIISELIRQRERGEFCDISLRLNGRHYPAHKAVLAASSPYFRSMFTSHMKEHCSPEVDLSESLRLENDRTFKRVLRFIYSGDIEINVENVDDVLRLADFLLLDEVREYCRQFYLRHGNITPANALGLAELAERHNLPEVARVAKAIVATRFHDCIVQRDEILEVSTAGLRQLLGDANTIQFTSSDTLIQLLLRWTRHDPTRRQQDMLRLLPYIRLTCLSCDSLQSLLSEPAVCSNPDWTDLLQALLAQKSNIRGVNQYPHCFSSTMGPFSDEPMLVAMCCDTQMKFMQLLTYHMQQRQWYKIPIKTDTLMSSIPKRFDICGMHMNKDNLYLFMNYSLPYPSNMLQVHIMALNIQNGQHKLMTFHHAHNFSAHCQTVLTDDRSLPVALVCCNDHLCLVGNVQGTGHVFVCSTDTFTYTCHPIPQARFVSQARAVACGDHHIFVWCRHRFGHEEYCINKQVSFVKFDIRKQECQMLASPTGIGYDEFSSTHTLCVENNSALVHSPGHHSQYLRETTCEWLTYPKPVPTPPESNMSTELLYHGCQLYAYIDHTVYQLDNPAAYASSLTCLQEGKTVTQPHPPPPVDGVSLLTSTHLSPALLCSYIPVTHFDDTYTNLMHSRTESPDYESDGSEFSLHSNGKLSMSDNDEWDFNDLEYEDDIYGYYFD